MWGWHKGESVPVTVGLAHRLVAIKKSKKQQFQEEFLQEVSLGAKIRF
jgi:ACR3 family arsenite efflux pump ArsB